MVDQFEDPKDLTLVKPTRLCNPTDKNGEGIKNLDQHLVCYKTGFDKYWQQNHLGRDVYTNNQFGPLEGQAHEEKELCVPSSKEIVTKDPEVNAEE